MMKQTVFKKLLALLLCAVVLTSAVPATVYAESIRDDTSMDTLVALQEEEQAEPADEVAALLATINGFIPASGTGSLMATASGNTITVTGNAAAGSAVLVLPLNDDVTIKWQAQFTSNQAAAIHVSGGTFEVAEGSKVETTRDDGVAIYAAGGGQVIVNGGTVQATTGCAIHVTSDQGTVVVATGMVSVTTGTAIYLYSFRDTLNITGGTVQATGAGGSAIFADSNSTGASISIAGGTVCATTGAAVQLQSASTSLAVTGGAVFAYGDAILGSDQVLELPGGHPFSGPGGTGMVLAWDAAAGMSAYTARDTKDIQKLPADDGTAHWAQSAAGGGIAWARGGKSGFVPLGVNVELLALTGDDLNYTDPGTLQHVYNGSPQGIGAVSCTAPGFNRTTGGALTVGYSSAAGGVYNDTAPPIATDNYTITVNIAGGTEYASASLMLPHHYIIEQRPVTIVVNDAEVPLDGILPSFSYTLQGLAPGDTEADALSMPPTLFCLADSSSLGSFAIGAGGAIATENYNIFAYMAGTLKVTGLSHEDMVRLDTAALTEDLIKGDNPSLNNVTGNLYLPETGPNGTTINWMLDEEDDGSVLDLNSGEVSRPPYWAADATVTLTATVYSGEVQDTKSFEVVIKAAEWEVTSVKMAQSGLRLTKGKSATVGAVAYLQGGTSTSSGLTWASGNENVATVQQNGKITAQSVKKTTKVTITATAANGKEAKMTVTVLKSSAKPVKVNKVAISGGSSVLRGDKSPRLKAKITPGGATAAAISWKSSKPKVLAVDKTGKLTPKREGTAKITLKVGKKSATVSITVVAPVRSVTIYQKEVVLSKAGKTAKLGYTHNQIGSTWTGGIKLTWASSNPAVATVSSKGVVTAQGPGTATITVSTANGKKDTVPVTVKE